MGVFHERFSLALERIRDKDDGYTRKEFADLCGLTEAQVNNYLAGRGTPSFDKLIEIAKQLGTNVSWLIGESDLHYDPSMDLYPYLKGLTAEEGYLVKEFVGYLHFKMNNREKENEVKRD